MKSILIILSVVLIHQTEIVAQGSPDYNGGLKVPLNEDGSKYFRFISWAQMQANYNDNLPTTSSPINLNLRRARMLMFSQINKDFLILTHFGLNSLNSGTLVQQEKVLALNCFFMMYGRNITYIKTMLLVVDCIILMVFQD